MHLRQWIHWFGGRKTGLALGLAAALAGSGPAFAAEKMELPKLTTKPSEIPAGRYEIDPAHTNVLFRISHFGLSEYFGRFNTTSGVLQADPANPERSKLEVVIRADSADTTSPDLNKHLRGKDFFNVDEHPEIRFVSTEIRPAGDTKGKVTGNLTMLGVTRPATLDVTFRGGAVNPISKKFTLGFSARTEIRRSEFGMNAYLPVVGDNVALEIESELNHGDAVTTKP